jgi:hypothetical protein
VKENTEITQNEVIQIQAPAASGLYLVEITSGVRKYVGKVVVK